jgi:hypothetical protein
MLYVSSCSFNPDEGGLIYDIGDFMVGLQWLGEDIDMDEVECILVNMIFKVWCHSHLTHLWYSG